MKTIRNRDVELINSKSKLPYKGFVYFIGNFKQGYVKIGYSEDPVTRLNNIQTGCPFKVKLFFLLNKPKKAEVEFHNKFSFCNSYGEWFYLKGSLLTYVMNAMGLRENPVKQSKRVRVRR